MPNQFSKWIQVTVLSGLTDARDTRYPQQAVQGLFFLQYFALARNSLLRKLFDFIITLSGSLD